MNIQTEKIELVKRLLDTDDVAVLQQVKDIFENQHQHTLPDHVKAGIQRGMKQADEGSFTPNDTVMRIFEKYL